MIYTLNLSSKETLRITEEEKKKFESNLDKNFIKIGDSIINPSFVVSITVDREATKQEAQNNTPRLPAPEKDVKQIGTFLKKYNPYGKGKAK